MNPSTSFLRVPQLASAASRAPQPSAGTSGVRPLAPSANCVQQPALRTNCGQQLAPGASPGIFPHLGASAAASARREASVSCPVAFHPAGFTLVELMIVIGIIGLLTAISVPVVMRSLTKARNAAIKAEIDMLHMAIMNYKNEYGSFPPAFDPNLRNDVNPQTVAQKHLQRLFPRCNPQAQFLNANWDPLTPENALVAWLTGFTNDPTQPLTGSGGRKKLYDFDQGRITSGFAYHAPGKQSAPYIYIPNSLYGPVGVGALIPTYPSGGSNPYFAQRVPPAANPANYQEPTQPPFNPDTFQILSAGRDEVFYTDDDLSNFWPGTRREYLDSLKN
jgi:prepilin-type N-terminal cleavage/methylation domain-containing protein